MLSALLLLAAAAEPPAMTAKAAARLAPAALPASSRSYRVGADADDRLSAKDRALTTTARECSITVRVCQKQPRPLLRTAFTN